MGAETKEDVGAPHVGFKFLCGLAVLVGLVGILAGFILLVRAFDPYTDNYALAVIAVQLIIASLAMIWSGLLGHLLLDIRDLLAKPPLKQ